MAVRKWFHRIVGAAVVTLLCVTGAAAVPVLQLYIDGATYDGTTETWVLSGSSSPFTLWVIGNVSGEGGKGTISGVLLSAAVPTAESGSISLASTTTGHGTYTDPSTPSAPSPTANFPSADGAVPKQSDGSSIGAHGVYGAGTEFFEWGIGSFSLTDSPIADFITSFPGVPTCTGCGQINAYTVTVTGFSVVHFDTYDTYVKNDGTHAVFAPFSHDGGAGGFGGLGGTGGLGGFGGFGGFGGQGGSVPGPATIALLGIGLVAVSVGGRMLRRR